MKNKLNNLSVGQTLLILFIFWFSLIIYHLIYVNPIWEWITQAKSYEKMPFSIFGSLITSIGSLYALFGISVTVLSYFGLKEISTLKEVKKNLEERFVLIEAELLYDRQKYDKAWENLLSLPDSNWEVCLYKGLIRNEFGDTNDALNYFSKALNLQGCEKAEIYTNIGDVYSDLGDIYSNKKQYEIAIENYDKAIEAKKNFAIPFAGKSYAARRLYNVEEALKISDMGIQIDPSYGKNYYNKACYLSLLNRGDEAIEPLKKSIQLNPELRTYALTEPDFYNIIESKGYKEAVLCLPLIKNI
jgi:tetratricopeptide (TPR) repeat protein